MENGIDGVTGPCASCLAREGKVCRYNSLPLEWVNECDYQEETHNYRKEKGGEIMPNDKTNRMSRRGFHEYWKKYPHHFTELYGMPPTEQNLNSALAETRKIDCGELLYRLWVSSVRNRDNNVTYRVGIGRRH